MPPLAPRSATAKGAVYRAARGTGLFHLARRRTQNGLRILCYHGIAHDDEHRFEPFLFMRLDTFARRLAILAERRFPVLPLDEAVRRLKEGSLPPAATVITIDDGFRRTLSHAVPALEAHGFPATVYVTSYYVERCQPIFRLVVRYACWKTTRSTLRPADLGLDHLPPVDCRDKRTVGPKIEPLILHGQDALDEPARRALGWRVCEALGVDTEKIRRAGALTLMNADEIRELDRRGFDVQLHSHNHLLSADPTAMIENVRKNVDVLRPLTTRPLEHFCYPSGRWSKDYWPPLQGLGIRTATTCDPGLNYGDTPPLALRRFIDHETLDELSFEAELSGFAEVLRRGRRRFRRLGSGSFG